MADCLFLSTISCCLSYLHDKEEIIVFEIVAATDCHCLFVLGLKTILILAVRAVHFNITSE